MRQTSDRDGSWTFLEATPRERDGFADLDATLRRAESSPVLEPNRFREVRRVRGPDGAVYYLKLFHHTQLKNRWRNRLTRPFCDLDAEREARVAASLSARGVATARPVAIGRLRGASYYLCAALDGEPLRARVERGDCPRPLYRAAARFAGSIARAGVVLPDLSADHVFVQQPGPGGAAPSFAVIDLHNGRSWPPIRVRDVVRALRRFRSSVRGLAVPRHAALAFAVAFVRAAGLGSRTRSVLRRLPPFDTHGRYEVPGRSRAYGARDPARGVRELQLLRRVWPGRRGDEVLDSPCGAGRLEPSIAGELGARYSGADRSLAMLRQLGRRLGHPGQLERYAGAERLVQADATELPFAARAVDGVVVFRFLHHLPPATARRVVAEAARVADRFVVVTFFHPVSTHNVTRRVVELWTRRARTRFCVWPGTLRRWLDELGFRLTRTAAHGRFRRDLWIASFERRDAPATARRSPHELRAPSRHP